MNPMVYFAVIIAILFIIIMIYAIHREIKIRKSGIEVDAVVTKTAKMHNEQRVGHYDYTPYVEYVGDDNQKHEARLNCNSYFSKGTKLKVKYLPGKYNYVVLIVK